MSIDDTTTVVANSNSSAYYYYDDDNGDDTDNDKNDDANTKANATDVISTDNSALVTSFTECMLQLEEHFQSIVPPIAIAGHPLPFSVEVVDDEIYVFLTLALSPQQEWSIYYDSRTIFACNGIEGGTVLPTNRKMRTQLQVKCPQKFNSSHDSIQTFSITPLGNETERIEYNLDKFFECEQKDIELSAGITARARNASRSIKTGVTATFAGNRQEALEWATYHHLMGFDHVWLYVNEPWEDGKDLPPADFVTYIPYSNRIHDISMTANVTFGSPNMPDFEVFRGTSQIDALWRARKMGLDWMCFPDLDEIVVLGANAVSNSTISNLTASVSPLQTYLTDFSTKHGDDYSAIMLPSVPFGRNIENETKPELLIDYTWRLPLNPSNNSFLSRSKLLVDVRRVHAVGIHYYAGDGHKIYVPKTADQLRVNHFKNKEKGVFNMKYKYLGPPNIVEDTQMRDEYRDRVVELMASIRGGEA